MTTVETTDVQDTRIDGLTAAALLAAGFGAFVLGFLTTINEASTGVHDFLQFTDEVGPLAGKTILAAIAYFGSLLVFALVWRGRQLALKPVLIVAGALLLLGFLGTFPIFFQAFAS
jgi:hypothetical protein